VTSQPRAFFAVDLGSATTSAALVGHVGGRWRLIASTAAPASVDVDGMIVGLLRQIQATDPDLLSDLAGEDSPDVARLGATWTRLEAKTTPQRRIAVIAGSRRQRRRLEQAALRAGWLVVGGSSDDHDAVALSRLVLSTRTDAVLLGADRSPSGDEKRNLPELAALVAAARHLRPELTVVLAGGAAAYESPFTEGVAGVEVAELAPEPEAAEAVPVDTIESGPSEPPEPTDSAEAAGTAEDEPSGGQPTEAAAPAGDSELAETVGAVAPVTGVAPVDAAVEEPAPEDKAGQSKASPNVQPTPSVAPAGESLEADAVSVWTEADRIDDVHVLIAPDADAGQPAGSALQQVLEGLRSLPNDSRLGVARSIASLAYVLDRPIEVVEVGLQGGLRGRSEPIGQGHFAVSSSYACLADGSFSPSDPSDEVIDSVFAWSTTALDRHRLMDRLHDLRLVPWGEAEGDGAVFRLAAAKGAVSRLVAATPEIAASAMPELIVAAGGIFASSPPAVVALALADVVRRPGISQLACDQARLLGPLGAIEDEAERRQLLANLADDILMPLGCLVMPAGVKPGRTAGTLKLIGLEPLSNIELHPGAVQVVDLPPGRTSKAEFDFKDTVRLTTRGHHFSVDVGGGLCGLLVDLRDVPLRMSDRPESRRSALDAWQRGMWPEIDE
jgi:hypothetical protein